MTRAGAREGSIGAIIACLFAGWSTRSLNDLRLMEVKVGGVYLV